MTRHLAFDLGAESGRAIVGHIHDGKLCLEEIHRFKTGAISVNNTLRCDILRYFAEIVKALKIYAKKYGTQLDSIGVDTWGCDFGLLDKNGKLIGNPYSYRDSRVLGMDKEIDEILGNERLYELTGIQMLPINTLNQIAGMRKLDDPTLDIAKDMLYMGDLLQYFLCGAIGTEYTTLSISQLYNNNTNDWDNEIFERFNIPNDVRTKIVYAGDVLGTLTPGLQKETGLGAIKIVTPAVHDTASAAVAIPAKTGEDWAYLSSGTWSMVGLENDSPIINKTTYEMNISNSGGVLGKSLFLKNVMGLWIIQNCKNEWNKTNPDLGYSEIVKKAQKAKPFYGYIEPDDLCFFAPDNMQEEICGYLNRTGQKEVEKDDIAQISRIVYESLALKYKFVFDKITKAADKDCNHLYILGGGSKNKMLNQFTANALGIDVMTGPIEATAIGNVMLQAYGLGLYKDLDEMRAVIANSFSSEKYTPEDVECWEKAYQEFLSITGLRN